MGGKKEEEGGWRERERERKWKEGGRKEKEERREEAGGCFQSVHRSGRTHGPQCPCS